VRWAVITLRRRPASGSTGDGCGTAIDQVIRDLEDLNGSTERDFLAVGEKLMEFSSTARQIASDMAALGELISGEHGRNVSAALTRILERARELDAGIEQSRHALEEVHGLSARIRTAFAGIGNTVATFRTLCTLTRIETSRLGDTGGDFGDLAAEVRPLSESIQTSGEGVVKASSQLDQGVQTAIRSASELRVRQLTELPGLIEGVIDGLKTFEERRRRAVESSARQAANYEALCEAAGNVVRSVQFHDITRQQIEHVVEALRQLRSACGTSRGPLPPDARAILAVQSSQLCGAARVFAASVGHMEGELENMAVRVQGMAEAGKSLMGISDDEHDSFFLRMEGHFTAILKMLGTCTTAQAEKESTAASLAETINRMRQSVAEVRGIEIRIQRIATNATIRATHIGINGDALNVIAEVMHRLALDTNANTEVVAGTLDAMADAAVRVSGRFGDEAPDARAGANEMVDEIRRSVVDLHSSNECSFSRVHQISTLGSRLAVDFGAVSSGFSAGALFAQVVARARSELDRIGAQAGGASHEGAETVSTTHLESLAERYTMQMERDVHDSVTRGSAMAAASNEEPVPVLQDGDLGDNVELF
jgi:hypothetical protein